MSFVAVGGIEPPRVLLRESLHSFTAPIFSRSCSHQLSYTTSFYLLSEAQAHAGAQPCLRYLIIRSWTNSEPSLLLFVLLIFAFLRLIRLSFSPTLPSDLHYYLPALLLRVGANSWPLQGSELTSLSSGCTHGFVPSLPLRPTLRSISLPFRFRVTYRLAPWLLTLVCDLNK